MTYNTRFVISKRKSSITAPAPLTTKLISKQAILNASKSILDSRFRLQFMSEWFFLTFLLTQQTTVDSFGGAVWCLSVNHERSHLAVSSCYI